MLFKTDFIKAAFSRRPRKTPCLPPLGVDISASAVHTLQLNADGTHILGWNEAPIAEGAVVSGRIIQATPVTTALRTACTPEHGHFSRSARIALPTQALLRQPLTLPDDLSPRDADLLALDAAAQLLRQPREAVYYEYFRDEGQDSSTLLAVRRDNIDERTRVLGEAGLVCATVDIEHYALLAGLATQIEDLENRSFCMTIAVLDLSGTALQILVLRENMLYQAGQLLVSLDQASIVAGVERLVQQYRMTYLSIDIERLIVEGMPEMIAQLTEAIGVESIAADPFMGLTPPPHGLPSADGWARACGLARRAVPC